jgi:hypothetical protein
MITSGSAADQAGSPSTSASPVRNTMRSLIADRSLGEEVGSGTRAARPGRRRPGGPAT